MNQYQSPSVEFDSRNCSQSQASHIESEMDAGREYHAGGTSSVVYIVCSAPQGSVLGPVLFVLYVADLADISNNNNACQWLSNGTNPVAIQGTFALSSPEDEL